MKWLFWTFQFFPVDLGVKGTYPENYSFLTRLYVLKPLGVVKKFQKNRGERSLKRKFCRARVDT